MQSKNNTAVFPGGLKKNLGFFLAVVMLITTVSVCFSPLMSLRAYAAGSRSDIKTTYSWTISVATTDAADCNDNDGARVRLYGITNNGQGSETQIQEWGYTSYAQDGGTLTASGTSTSFPYKIYVSVDLDAGAPYRVWEGTLTLTVNGTQMFSSGVSLNSGQNGLWSHQFRSDERHTDTRPSLAGVYIDGGSTTVYTSGSATSSYTIKGYDNYDVQWSATLSNPSISSSNGNATVSGSGATRTVTFGNNNGVDYSTTISGSAGGKSTSGWQNVGVTVYTTHTLTVNVNGGDGGNYTRTGYTGGTTTINNPSKTGYDFSSWTVSGGSMSGTTYTFENRGSSTITANWTPHTYNVVYDKNTTDTVGNMPSNQTKTYGTNLTLASNVPTRTGYTFGGWDIYVGSTSQNANIAAGGTLSTDYVSAQNGTVTLKAKWNPKTFSVNFNGNTNSGGSTAAQSYTSGTAQALRANGFTKSYTVTYNYNGATGGNGTSNGTVTYSFKGWNTSAGSTSTSGDTTTVGAVPATYSNQQSVSFARDSDLTLYAAWQTTANYVTAPKPTKNGYTFGGWYWDSGLTSYACAGDGKAQPVTANANLYAKWTANPYVITYTDSISTGTSAAGSLDYKITDTSKLKTPTKTGYDFAGWKCTTADGNWTLNTVYEAQTSVNGKYGSPTLEAQWTPHTYNFVFNANKPANALAANNVNMNSLTSQQKTYGTNMTMTSTKPTLTGWTFLGWNTAADGSGTTFTAGGTVSNDTFYPGKNGNVQLYAMWELTDYVITYAPAGGAAVTAKHYNINNTDYTLPSTTRTGYTFKHWQVTTAGGSWTLNATFDEGTGLTGKYGNVTLTAVWEANPFQVVFKPNGGTGTMANQTFYSGTAQNLTANAFTRSHTVTYNYNNATGGNGTTSATVTYSFDGWSESAGSASTSGDTTTIGGTKVYDDGGSLNLERDTAYTLYARWKTTTNYVTLPTPTRNGYTFDGWWTAQSGDTFSGTRYEAGAKVQPITANMQLYAKWNINTYTVTYTDSISTNESAAGTQTYKITDNTTLKTPTKTGYDFNTPGGWKCTATSGSSATETATSWTVNSAYDGGLSLNGKYGNVTLEAQWTPHTYSFVYNANKPASPVAATADVSGVPGATVKTYDANVNLSSAVPTLTGWTFAGWNTADDGSGTTLQSNALIDDDTYYPGKGGTVQLYAVWTQNSYQVRFNSSLKTEGSMGNQTFAYEVEQALSGNAFVRKYFVTFNENYTGAPIHAAEEVTYAISGWTTTDHESETDYAPVDYTDAQTVKQLDPTDGGIVDLYIVWTDGHIELKNFTRTGYDVEGWYTSVVNNEYTGRVGAPADTYYPTADVTLYAKWIEHTYDIVYDANTGTGAVPATQADCLYFSSYTVAGDTGALTKTGYTLTGWTYTKDDGTEGRIPLNGSVTQLTMNDSVTLYAEWTPNPYTVVFHKNDGTTDASTTTQTFDAAWVNVPSYTRTGYSMEGWYSDPDCTDGNEVNVDLPYTHPANWDLYAKWVGLVYNVKYNENTPDAASGTVTGMPSVNPVTKRYGTAITLADAPVLTGWTFGGWNTAEDGSGTTYGANASFNADPVDMTQNGTLELYAVWTPVTYTVSFAAGGGTGTMVSQTKTYDTDLALNPNTFSHTGYTFKDWTITSGGTAYTYNDEGTLDRDFASTQGATVVLTAEWDPITYTVTFNGNGSTEGSMASQSFDYDEEKSLTANAFARKYTVTYNYNNANEGNTVPDVEVAYTFSGWNTYAIAVDAAAAADYADQALVKNLRNTPGEFPLYAKWTSNSTALPEPVRYGYSFGGWYEDGDFTVFAGNANAAYTPSADVTLYAKWTTVDYTISYTDSLDAAYDESQTYNIEGTATLRSISKTGYDFAGWLVTSTDTLSNWTGTYTAEDTVNGKYGNVTLEAQWTPHTYTVAYDANLPKDSKGVTTAGSATVPASQTKTYAEDLTLSDAVPALTGYTFVGWNTVSTAAAKEYDPADTFDDTHYPGKNGTVTLYAIWAPIAYTVAYDGNGNTLGNTASQNATYDVYFNLTTNGFVRTHTVTYKYQDGRADTQDTATAAFNGWTCGGNTYVDGQEVVNLTSTADATVTLTANWTYGSVILPAPTRTGYTFKGWYAEEACTTKVGDGDESYTTGADVVLYAKWEAVTYTVEYYAGTDASGDRPANQSVVYNTLGVNAYATQGSFVKPGYSFTGWNTAADGSGSAVAAGYAFTNNNLIDWADENDVIKLYAQWSPNTYVIVYDKGAGTSGATGSQTIRYDLLGSFAVAENGFAYPGYTFTEWQDGQGTAYAENDAVTSALLLDNGVLNTSDGYYYLTLTAQWDRNRSTLNIDHGNNDAVIEVTQDSSTTYNVDGSFTKTGYTFNGWVLTGEGGAAPNGSVDDLSSRTPTYTFGFANRVTDTLTAQWNKNPYTITYHYNVPDAPASEKSVTVYYDTEFTFAPEDYFGYRLGYTIDGWATGADGEVVYDCSQVSPATENLATGEEGDTNVDLYAVWTAKEYEVTFWVNTGFHFADAPTAESQTKTITFGGSQTFTVVLEEGYTQSTGADPAAHVTSGTAAVPDGVKTGSTIVFTVTNHGESDVVVETDPLALNTYTVTVIPESGDWNEADKGYRRPTVQTTVTHGSDVTFSITLNEGYNVASGSDLIVSVTVGGTSVTPVVTGSYTYTVANATGDVVITLTDAEKNTSAVKFDANGGKWTGDVTLVTESGEYGDTYTVTVPSRDGYTFAGWSKVTEGTNASTAAGTLSGNTYAFGTAQGTDYYEAQWTANTYTVVFDGNNGTPGTQTETATYGQTWPTPDTEPTRTGYDFGGWCTDAEGTTSVDLTQNYTLTAGTTVYAKWSKHQYSITLDGSPVGYTVVYPHNAYYNDNYTFTVTPLEGYDVNALNVSVTGNGGFTTSVDNGVMTVNVTGVNDNNVITVSGALLTYNITTNLVNAEAFAAQPASVTVTYNTTGVTVEVTMADGFQDTAPTAEVISAQTGLTAAVALKDGATDTYVITLSDPITADVTLNLTGEANAYTVTLTGSEVGYTLPDPASDSIMYLGYANFIITLADGYTQTDASDITWTGTHGEAMLEKISDTQIRVIIESTEPGNVVIDLGDAVQNTYTLTFINNGGSTLTVNDPVPATSSTVAYGDTFTVSVTVAEGYDPATAALTSSNADVTVTAAVEGSTVTFTANNYFTGNTVLTLQPAAANRSTLTVDLDGGTLTGVADGYTYTGEYKETRSFGKPTRTGYTFASWVLGGDENGTLTGAATDSAVYTFGPTANAADTLTATWNANTYQVIYYKNDGSEGFTGLDVTYNGSWPAAPAFTRTGYDFLGWYDAAGNGDGTGANAVTFTDPYTTDGNTVVYAHWTKHTSTLTVDPDGGKVVIGATEYNNTVYTAVGAYLDTVTVGEPTKTGYDFAGWTRSGENGAFANGVYTYGPADGAEDTFTAEWTPKTYTVTYYTNDGTAAYTTRTATYNAAWPEAPTVSWAGHTFDGWFTAADDTGSAVTFEGNYTTADHTAVYAHWHINHSYVLFTFDGATMTVDASVYNGSFSADGDSGDDVTIAVPVKTGYTFTGWTRTTAANGTLEGNTYTFGNAAGTAEAPETFVAQFSANTYTVTFDGNDGTPNSQTATATYGQAYPAPASEPTRTGYSFAGWFTAASGGTEVTPGTTPYELTAATTLYAHWDIHSSTVTVKADGGNWSGSTDDIVYTENYGTAKTIPEPAKTGYTFSGWALSGDENGSVSGNTYTFGAADNANDILTAQWTVNTSTVNVELAGGAGATSGAYTQAYGTTLELAEPTRTGYTFAGWTLSANANGTLDGVTYTFGAANGTTDTITANWTVNSSTVTVKADGGNWSGSIEDKSYTASYGSEQAIPVPTRTGYTFAGWALTSEGTVNGAISGNTYTFGPAAGANDILTAQWTANTYTVVYDANGGVPTTQTAVATYNEAYPAANDPTRTGYDFAGWFTASEGGDQITLGSTVYMLASGTTLYAHWEAHESTVNVVLDGGTGATSGTYTQAYGTTLTLAEPTKTGYTFAGWTLSEGANGTLNGNTYTFGAAKNVTDTVTANWTVNTSTVNVVLDGGTGATEGAYTQDYDTTLTLAEPTKTGYTFVGWTLSEGANGTLDGVTYTFGAAKDTTDTITANWTVNTSTVTVALDGGTGATSGDYTQAYNTVLTLSEPAREGYHFTGWVLSDGANGTLDGNVYTFGAAKDTTDTVTATWEIDTFTVTLTTGEGYTVEEGPQSPVDWNTDSYVTIRLDTAYSASDAPAATVNGSPLAATDNGDGTFTYTVTGIKEDKAIVIGPAARNTYTVTVAKASGAKGILLFTPETAVTVEHGAGATVTVTLADGYSASDAPAVTLKSGAAVISGGVKTTEDGKTVYTYTVSDVTADSEIEIASATPNTYTVYYYRNDGTDAYRTESVTFDGAWPTAPTFTLTGYTFVGWFTGAADTAPAFSFTDPYTTVGDTEVYAHWTVNRSTLTVDPAGGSVNVGGTAYTAEQSFTQDYNTTLTVGEPTREGYHFTGWTEDITNGSFAGNTYTFGAEAGEEDRLTATWEIDTFTVTLTTGEGYTVEEGPQSPVDWNTDSYVTIRLSTGYVNSPAPVATVNGSPLAATDNHDGTFTYTVTGIKEDKAIVIGDATRDNCFVSVSKAAGANGIESFTPTSPVSVEYATGVTYITVTLEGGYSDSAAPAVTKVSGVAEISAGVVSTVDGKTVYTYTVTNVTEDTEFEIGSADINRYDIAVIADGTGYVITSNPSGMDVVDHGGSATLEITLNEAYSDSAIPSVTVKNAEDETIGSVTGVKNGDSNVITYTVSNITDDIIVTVGPADINRYNVTLVADGTGYTVTQDPTGVNVVNYGGSVVAKLTLDAAYTNSAIPSVTVKNAADQNIGTAIPSRDGSEITYTVYGITDNVTVTIGPAVINTYVITVQTGEGAQIKNADSGVVYNPGDTVTVTHGTVFRFRMADPTLTTPVYVNGVTVLPDSEGVFTIVVTQDTVITTNKLEYIAIFQNYDGSIVEKHIIIRGNSAFCNTVPTKPATSYHDYVFSGWLCIDPAGEWTIGQNMTNMTEDRVFMAQYNTLHKNLPIASDGTNHWRYCPDCGYTEGLEAHVAGATEIENFVAATCSVKGGYDSVVYCEVCHYEMSREAVVLDYDYNNHSTTATYSEVLYEPTCTENGMKVFYCADCDHVVRYEEIPVSPANHCWHAWTDNGDGTHSRGCVYCGDTSIQTKPHSLREVYRCAATCVDDGVIVSYCPDCATVITKTLPATGVHTPGDPYQVDRTEPTCTQEGGYYEVRNCLVCRAELSRTYVTLPATGIHVYEISVSPEHPTCMQTEPIVITYTCVDCGETFTKEVQAPGEHTVAEWTITKTPTESDPLGSRTGVCSLCGETVTEELYYQPLGQRFIKFVTTDGVVFTYVPFEQNDDGTWSYNPANEARVSGDVTYYSNVTMKFFVTVNSRFPYSDYDVYLNSVKMTQNPDGSYSIPASGDSVTVQVIGTTPAAVNPGDNGTNQGGNAKISFWQRIVNFFRSIGDFFRNLFS